MGYHTYLAREDNSTRFELGKLQYGLQDVFQDIADSSRCMILTDPDVLAEFILDEILARPSFWRGPRDYIPFANALANRLVRWGDGRPVVVRGESELHGRWELTVVTDSYVKSEWPYYDVLQSLRPELWVQINSLSYSPSESAFVSHVRNFRLINYKRLGSNEEREVFLSEMTKLQPLTTNRDCGFLGCAIMGPHDHAPIDTPKTLLFCGCDCHVNPVVFTGFHFCCHEVNAKRESQTPRAPQSSPAIKLGDFTSFRFPIIRQPFPNLFP